MNSGKRRFDELSRHARNEGYEFRRHARNKGDELRVHRHARNNGDEFRRYTRKNGDKLCRHARNEGDELRRQTRIKSFKARAGTARLCEDAAGGSCRKILPQSESSARRQSGAQAHAPLPLRLGADAESESESVRVHRGKAAGGAASADTPGVGGGEWMSVARDQCGQSKWKGSSSASAAAARAQAVGERDLGVQKSSEQCEGLSARAPQKEASDWYSGTDEVTDESSANSEKNLGFSSIAAGEPCLAES
jgi:hypothetical protein